MGTTRADKNIKRTGESDQTMKQTFTNTKPIIAA